MADQGTNAQKRSKITWRKAVFVGSLGLNLIVIGLVAGAIWRTHGAGPNDMRHSGFARPYIDALPRAARREIFSEIHEKGHNGPTRSERRAQYTAVLNALEAKPFSPVALADVLGAQSQSAVRFQDVAQNAWLGKITRMTDQERAIYTDRLADMLARGGRGPKRQDD